MLSFLFRWLLLYLSVLSVDELYLMGSYRVTSRHAVNCLQHNGNRIVCLRMMPTLGRAHTRKI